MTFYQIYMTAFGLLLGTLLIWLLKRAYASFRKKEPMQSHTDESVLPSGPTINGVPITDAQHAEFLRGWIANQRRDAALSEACRRRKLLTKKRARMARNNPKHRRTHFPR
jgi:hypothetical protein